MALGGEITRYSEFNYEIIVFKQLNQAKHSWHIYCQVVFLFFFFSIWAVRLWDFQHHLNSLDNFVEAFLWRFEMSMNGCAWPMLSKERFNLFLNSAMFVNVGNHYVRIENEIWQDKTHFWSLECDHVFLILDPLNDSFTFKIENILKWI